MPDTPLPEWEALLSSAARLQKIVPESVLVGGTAAATYAHHRVSVDHDHTLNDLRGRFDEILALLESVAGWRTDSLRFSNCRFNLPIPCRSISTKRI